MVGHRGWRPAPPPLHDIISPSFFAPARALTTRPFNLHLVGVCVKIPSAALSEEDTTALEEEIANFKSEDEAAKTTTTYVPVLLDDKVVAAYGHYDEVLQTEWVFDRG